MKQMGQIPMLDLKAEYEFMKEDIDSAMQRCLEHQKWILGPEVKELEDKVAGYIEAKHCVGVSSGTDALVISLRALAIKTKRQEYFDRNDLIITTPFTFTATGDAILRSGATPVFVDIDPETYNIDSAKIRDYLLSASNVVGIIPVHLYGRPCEMDSIMELAEERGLFVVEDVAQAMGGEWNGKRLGAIGTAGAFSFFPSKNLGCFGDGGMVATNDGDVAELIGMLIKHGGKDKYNVDHLGYNARLDTIQAAILLARLKYLDRLNELRRRIADRYDSGLKDVEGITIPGRIEGHVYHQYTIRIGKGMRDTVQESLKERGVSSMVYYPVVLNRMRVFEGRCEKFGSLENAETAAREVLSLPMEPLMDERSIDVVLSSLKEAVAKVRK